MATKCTVWDLLAAAAKFDGSPTVNEDVAAILKKHGHSSGKTAGCTNTIMAMFYMADAIDIIGGYENNNRPLMASAKKAKLWHDGPGGILPGDIVIFGRSGKSNHTELAVGDNIDISGNYKVDGVTGCYRRKRSSHSSSILGYIRPKFAAMPEMNDLQVVIEASNCILGVYGTGDTRKRYLSVFGSANTEKIQHEVERVEDDMDKVFFDLAVYAIAGYAGKNKYRQKRLGNYATAVQDLIDDIYALRGRSVEEAAQLVLEDKFGKNDVRRLLLSFCEYDPDKVQAAVNAALGSPQGSSAQPAARATVKASVVSLFRDVARESKSVDGLQGNLVVIKDPASSTILGIDSMRAGAIARIKAELKGYEHIDWYISHPHSDHMGSNVNNLVKAGLIRKIYLPQRSTISSEYKQRFDALVKQCEKSGTKIVYLKQGDSFDSGGIHGNVFFQQLSNKTDSTNMKSLCTIFTVDGKRILYCGDHHTGKKESKLDPSSIGHVDAMISAHHGLFTGDTKNFVKAVSPDWIIHAGWKSWPLGTVAQDAKVRGAQKAYQLVGNLLPGDVVGRTELTIEDGVITAKGEKNMTGKTVKYSLNGKTYQKTVYVCEKTAFMKVRSMIPTGAKFA